MLEWSMGAVAGTVTTVARAPILSRRSWPEKHPTAPPCFDLGSHGASAPPVLMSDLKNEHLLTSTEPLRLPEAADTSCDTHQSMKFAQTPGIPPKEGVLIGIQST